MAKKNDAAVAANDTTVTETIPEYGPDEVLALIVKDSDGNYHVKDTATGEEGPACKFCDEGDKTIVLTPNRANRKWANRKKADEAIDVNGSFPLTYKASKHIGSTGTKIPNTKMMEWYRDNVEGGQALYDEYMAIMNEAIAARDAAKAKPMTELEKAQAKLRKAQESYEKLLKQAQA